MTSGVSYKTHKTQISLKSTFIFATSEETDYIPVLLNIA